MTSMAEFEKTRCRSCGASIVWAVTIIGKPIPIDALPVDGGNIRLTLRLGRPPLAEVVDEERDDARYVTHFVTCRDAGGWRRK